MGRVRGGEFHGPVPVMKVMVLFVMGVLGAGWGFIDAVFVAVGDRWVDAAAAAVVVVISVARGHWEAVLAIRASGPGAGWGLAGRRRWLAEGWVQVLVSAELWFIVHVSVIDQRDVVDEVVDEELWVGHEVVDGVAGFRFLPALVQRTTECFHHSHLPRGGNMRERPKEKTEQSQI